MSMREVHATRLRAIRTEADNLAGAAVKMAAAIDEALAGGREAHIQPQLAFMTGALVRLTKDWGAVEYLQLMGAVPRKPAPDPIKRESGPMEVVKLQRRSAAS